MPVVALLLLLTGCDALFRLSDVPAPSDAAAVDAVIDTPVTACPFVETFSATTADLIPSWMRTTATGCAIEVDDGVLVTDVTASVECYAELTSRTRFSFVDGGSLSVRIVAANVSGPAEGFLNLQLDDDDFYYMNLSGGKLGMLTRVAGAEHDALTIAYDPIEHAYWRIELRLAATDSAKVVYQTSFNGLQWVEHSVALARVPSASLVAQLGIGTYEAGAPAQRVRFDDVTVCAQ